MKAALSVVRVGDDRGRAILPDRHVPVEAVYVRGNAVEKVLIKEGTVQANESPASPQIRRI